MTIIDAVLEYLSFIIYSPSDEWVNECRRDVYSGNCISGWHDATLDGPRLQQEGKSSFSSSSSVHPISSLPISSFFPNPQTLLLLCLLQCREGPVSRGRGIKGLRRDAHIPTTHKSQHKAHHMHIHTYNGSTSGAFIHLAPAKERKCERRRYSGHRLISPP